MTINIIEHLENIKIFTDYINSGLDSVEMFWVQIDKGDSGKNKKVMKFDTNGYDPTEEELEQLLDDRKRKEYFDLSEEYTKVISDKILTKLEYDKATVPDKIELSELYEKIIEENGNLQEFLNTTKDIVDQYVEIIGADLPKNFFSKLSQFEKESTAKPIDYEIDKLKDIKSNDFSVPEWATIFHYAYTKKLLQTFNTKKATWEWFMSENKIDTTSSSFKTNYYETIRRLYTRQDYPIKKLEKIMPFIEKNYKKALTSLIEDKEILENEKSE